MKSSPSNRSRAAAQGLMDDGYGIEYGKPLGSSQLMHDLPLHPRWRTTWTRNHMKVFDGTDTASSWRKTSSLMFTHIQNRRKPYNSAFSPTTTGVFCQTPPDILLNTNIVQFWFNYLDQRPSRGHAGAWSFPPKEGKIQHPRVTSTYIVWKKGDRLHLLCNSAWGKRSNRDK